MNSKAGRLLAPPRTLRTLQNQDPEAQKQEALPAKKKWPPYQCHPPPHPYCHQIMGRVFKEKLWAGGGEGMSRAQAMEERLPLRKE